MLGHDGPPTNLWKENLITAERLAECPVRLSLRRRETALGRELDRHMASYPNYERGALLLAGGLGDQPARYLEIMAMIANTHATIEAKHLEIREANKPPGDS